MDAGAKQCGILPKVKLAATSDRTFSSTANVPSYARTHNGSS
jgi:hypothetical protein